MRESANPENLVKQRCLHLDSGHFIWQEHVGYVV